MSPSSRVGAIGQLKPKVTDGVVACAAFISLSVGLGFTSSTATSSDGSLAIGAALLEGSVWFVRGLVRLSEDVHAPSYRLHPSILEDLGLATALKSECERFSQTSSTRLETSVQDLPETLPHDVALCLFRIAQEGLRNIARHAGASQAEIRLQRLDGGLQLTVGRWYWLRSRAASHPDQPRAYGHAAKSHVAVREDQHREQRGQRYDDPGMGTIEG